ncbi:MAG: CpaF family protein, partial [Mesorhizobium sp.]
MTSRFSALQNRDALPQRVPETTPVAHHAVVIPTSRKALPAKPDTAPAKNANKVLDARVRIHRLLLEEINLVALERLPKDEMRRQVHDFVSEKTKQERMAINTVELDALVD